MVPIPDPMPEFLRVSVAAEGHIPLGTTRNWQELAESAQGEILFELEKGEEIGGLVHDEDGQPIAGATVHAWVWLTNVPRGRNVSLATAEFPIRTDAEGRWRAAYLPPGTQDSEVQENPAPEAGGIIRKNQVMVRLEHWDFVSERSGYSRSMSIADARLKQNVQVMSRGHFGRATPRP